MLSNESTIGFTRLKVFDRHSRFQMKLLDEITEFSKLVGWNYEVSFLPNFSRELQKLELEN
jgi:hypothetical protein